MNYIKLTVILMGLCAAIGTRAQTDTIFTHVDASDVVAPASMEMPAQWTYSQCVEWAVKNNTDIRSTLLSVLQADQDIAGAKDAWLPSVDFSTNHNFSNYPSPDTGRKANAYNSTYGVNASWTVWEGNARKYRLESSRMLRTQQLLAGENQVNELKLAILQAYLNILYSREAIEIARQTLEVSSAQAARTRRLVECGRSSKVDLAQIESQRAQDEYNLVQAESNLASDKMAMKKLLALGLDADMEIAETAFPDSEVTALLPAMETTYASAASWLPELKNNELSKEVYANDVKIARSGYMPNIALQGGLGTGYVTGGAGWGTQIKHGFNEYVGVSLSVPIFDGNKTKRAVAKAKIAEMEYDVNRDRLLDNLSQTIESLYIQARNAQAKYTSGITRLAASEQTAALVNRQFELGAVNPLELLTAHNNLLSARLEQLQNKYMAILANKTIGFYNSQQVAMP